MEPKSFIGKFILIFAAMTLAAAAAYPPTLGAQDEPDMAQVKGETAGQIYKNLLVLKDLPATELHPAMEYITMALGVRCSYCHAGGNFPSDEKAQKITARNMMKMMFALDNTAFRGKLEVTCFTCHRGAPIAASMLNLQAEMATAETSKTAAFPPVAVPTRVLDSAIIPEPGNSSLSKSSVQGLPSADEVLSHYFTALGGSEAIQKMSTLVEQGHVDIVVPALLVGHGADAGKPSTVRSTVEVYRKVPNKWVEAIHMPTGLSLEGFDGFLGWLRLPNRAAVKTGGELAVLKESAEFVPALHAKENYSHLEVDAIEKIGDRDTYRFIGLRAHGVDRFYFDTNSGLLLRSWTSMDSALGSFPQETNFENYRDVNGVQIPFTVREVSPEGNRTFQWEKIEINTPVDDSLFIRTAAAKPIVPIDGSGSTDHPTTPN